jgi:hypothetical protein
MDSMTERIDVPGDSEERTAVPVDDPLGIVPAKPGFQPVKDLSAFLQSLPDFGEDAERLRDVIAEERAVRRSEAETAAC